MAENPAAFGPLPEDSPHVMAATHVRRGMTPAIWQDAQEDGFAGVWEPTDPGGPTDREGQSTTGFESGPGRWKQM